MRKPVKYYGKLKTARRMFVLWVFVFCATLWCSANDSIVHELNEIVAHGRHVSNKITSTSSVQVIDKESLNKLGLQNMADAVRRFAGTNVRDYGGIGGLKTVSVRNLGAAHTAVSYDGVAVSNCQAGQIDISRFSLDNVSSLSLAVGQDDNILQPARLYASAGVINIQTERPSFDNGKHGITQIKLRAGSFGYITPSIRHWQKLADNTSLSADGSFTRADGNYEYELKNGKYTSTEKRNNSDVKTWQGEANLIHTFHNDGELSAKAGYFYSERGLPGAVILYNSISRERLWDENFFIQSSYKQVLSNSIDLQAQAKYNYSWNKYEDTDVKYENGKQTDINRQNEYYLSAAVAWQAKDLLSASLAQDGIINSLSTNEINGPAPIRYTSLTALNLRLDTRRFKMQGTLVGTFITENVKKGPTPSDRKRLSPTLSASLKPFDNASLYLRAMYKNTFRVPSFNDLYYLRVGNTSLRPERATEYSIGATFSGQPFAWLDHVTITADAYYNEVDDKIIAFPSTYVWKMQNYGKVQIRGIDITASTAIPFDKGCSVSLSGNYSWQRAIDVTDSKAKNYREQLPYTPEHNGNAAVMIDTPWFSLGYTMTCVGRCYYMAQNLSENEIAAYTEHTATLQREFKLKSTTLSIQAELINITNEQYEIIKYYPMPGRTWRLTCNIKF